MSGVVDSSSTREFDTRDLGNDSLGISGADAYSWCPGGFSGPGHISAIEKKLGFKATSRNWNTVQKLAAFSRPESSR